MDELKMKIVKSLGLNGPLLKEWGYELTKLITLIVPEGQAITAMQLLACRDSIVINQGDRLSSVIKLLRSTCYSFVLFFFNPGGKNSEEIKNCLLSIALSGSFENRPFHARIVLISECKYISDPQNDQFFVSFESLKELNLPIRSVVPDDDEVELVHDKVFSLTLDLEEDVGRALYAAAGFLYPMYSDSFEAVLTAAELLVEENEFFHDESGLVQLFREGLFCWRRETHFSDVRELPFISMKELKTSGLDLICYDEQYVFIAENTFRKILPYIPSSIGPQAIKYGLKAGGLLIPEPGNAKSYSVKMLSKSDAGVGRTHMLRFLRDKLVDRYGGKFIETCLFERSNEDED